jgi:hypothetical protein
VKKLLFLSVKAGEILAIKNILNFNRALLNEQIFGFEGADVYGSIPDSKSKRCYSYTGIKRDGYFYPLHVAAEYGNKMLVLMLAKAGADVDATDYRGSPSLEAILIHYYFTCNHCFS